MTFQSFSKKIADFVSVTFFLSLVEFLSFCSQQKERNEQILLSLIQKKFSELAKVIKTIHSRKIHDKNSYDMNKFLTKKTSEPKQKSFISVSYDKKNLIDVQVLFYLFSY